MDITHIPSRWENLHSENYWCVRVKDTAWLDMGIPKMNPSIVVVSSVCFLFLCFECSKLSLCLSFTDARINKLALDASERFETPVVKQRVRQATTAIAWRHFIPTSKVIFFDGLVRDIPFLFNMLDILEKGLIYSLFRLNKNTWFFFVYDASVDSCNRVTYAVTFPDSSLEKLIDVKKWFDDPISNGFDLDLIMDSRNHPVLESILLNNITHANRFGRGMRYRIRNLGRLVTPQSTHQTWRKYLIQLNIFSNDPFDNNNIK